MSLRNFINSSGNNNFKRKKSNNFVTKSIAATEGTSWAKTDKSSFAATI